MTILRLCRCQDGKYALCLPTAISAKGQDLVERHLHVCGNFVCVNCGGVYPGHPKEYEVHHGDVVITRLLELGKLPG